MIIPKEHYSKNYEWVDEKYESEGYSSCFREEEGVYEVYRGSKLIGKAENHAEVDEIIANHSGA